MSHLYIDIGAQRIQTWISQPLKLKYVRGASLRLSSVTRADNIRDWLKEKNIEDFIVPIGEGEQEEAGDIDGVVVLKSEGTDVRESRAHEVAHELLLHLNEKLPSVEWAGWCSAGDSFFDAYTKAEKEGKPIKRYMLQPSALEFTGVGLCEGCGMEPATRQMRHVQEYLGPNCASNLGDSEESDAAQEKADGKDAWPQTFRELAARVGKYAAETGGRNRPRNHVATICADGNRVGEFFAQLSGEKHEVKAQAIKALNTATHEALEYAVTETTEKTNDPEVVLKHYVGGDDVLASVTADEAWAFAIALIEGFTFYFAENVKRGMEQLSLPEKKIERLKESAEQLSLAVGIVFSHHAYPFYECRRLAEQALLEAKRHTQGKESAICWMDLTEDGGGSEFTQATWAITYEEAKDQLDNPQKLPGVFSLPTTARHNLRNQWLVWQRDATDMETRQKYIDAWVARREFTPVPHISAETLEQDLHRATWWPLPVPKEEQQ